jgi:hypothetical protein
MLFFFFFAFEKLANVNFFQILAQNDIIDAHGWSYKNNFMWCTLLHLYNCTFLRILSHSCAHVHLHSRDRGWHSDTSWSFFKLEELQIFLNKLEELQIFLKTIEELQIFLKNITPSLGRVESAKTPIFSFVFETWKVVNFLLKITTPLARVECAKTRNKVLSFGKQLRQD